jgi:hypothetical protein
MTTLELKLNLPDQLAKDAVRMGLTSPDSLQTLLREAVRFGVLRDSPKRANALRRRISRR